MVPANLAGLGGRYKTDLAQIWTLSTSRERGVKKPAKALNVGRYAQIESAFWQRGVPG